MIYREKYNNLIEKRFTTIEPSRKLSSRFKDFIRTSDYLTKTFSYLLNSGDAYGKLLGIGLVKHTLDSMNEDVEEGKLPPHYSHLITGLTQVLNEIHIRHLENRRQAA